MKIYRLQRISDGLFSTGGANPSFNKKGKIWRNIGFFKNHLNCIKENIAESARWRNNLKHPYTPASNFRIVEYVVTESLSDVTSLERFYENEKQK